MYLSKLELHGFKSFADPAVLHFDPGITAIVGPNGCGKSNIVDAVRWVIGEQRARILRSEKMENVIFNGTTKRRPLGLAQVQLTVENNRGVLPTEYNDVSVGRRLYRSGDSEYLLNDTPCRLKDIVDLFMDTGMGAGAYSVIELKMIEEMLSDNTEERRHLFEEAAGITKYKKRRTQTLRKLDGTQADLNRLRDLTDEIEKRVRSLKRQASKAERFKAAQLRLRTLELELAQREYDQLEAEQQFLEREIEALQDELQQYQARLAQEEARLEAHRKTLIDREHALSEAQQHLSGHLETTRSLEADLRLEEERLDAAHRDQARTMKEQEEAEARRRELASHAEDLKQQLIEAEPRRVTAEQSLEAAQTERDAARTHADAQRETLHALRRDEQQTLEQRADLRRRLDRLANRLDLLATEQTRLRTQAHDLAATLETSADTAAHAAERLATTAAAATDARTALDEAEQAQTTSQQTLDAAVETLRQTERQRDALAAEVQVLDSLVTSYDEFSDAVQFLARTPDWSLDDLRTVADVLACDEADRVALDAALGDLAACIVVQTQDEAWQALDLLRAEAQGRATFIVLDALAQISLPAPDDPTEAIRPLTEVVRVADPRYEPLVAILLHDLFLVDTLDEAHALAKYAAPSACFVARTGEWVDGRGVLHGGSAQTGASPVAGRLGRREQRDAAREQLAGLEHLLATHSAAVDDAKSALHAIPYDARRRSLTEAERAHTESERTHTRLAYEHESLARRQTELDERLQNLTEEQATHSAETEPLQTAIAEVEAQLETLHADRETAEAAFQATEAESRAAQEHLGQATVAAVEARNHYDNLQRDRDRTQQEIGALRQRAEDRQRHLLTLQQTIDAANEKAHRFQAELDAVRGGRSDLDEAVLQAKTALMQVKVDINTIENTLRKLRQEREARIRDENTRAIRRAELKTRAHDLVENIETDFGLSLLNDRVEIGPDFEDTAARVEVKKLRQQIVSMGNVNALALEEYEEESERLEFMMTQRADLEAAEATLLETIDEINTTAAARFDETYQAIRANFRDLFAELFGDEATADLELADPDDPLESPIEIMAKPRGKRPVSITQLSSGEKTLTAIALLFAIYLVKPSPFCLLDEVDAPLDDANVERYMKLIRRFSDDTQFILVTHNKRTMELADRLYGITMQEQGVSRLVGVKFDEALAMAE